MITSFFSTIPSDTAVLCCDKRYCSLLGLMNTASYACNDKKKLTMAGYGHSHILHADEIRKSS